MIRIVFIIALSILTLYAIVNSINWILFMRKTSKNKEDEKSSLPPWASS